MEVNSILNHDFSDLHQGLRKQEDEKVQNILRQQLQKTISYHDGKEAFHHGFLLGLLSSIRGYHIYSNRESGNGRPDLLLIPLDEEQPILIIELKWVEKLNQMAEGCEKALEQIDLQDYAAEPLDEGYQNILKYGICFCKKSCIVKSRKI